jgi:hypothetical protein
MLSLPSGVVSSDDSDPVRSGPGLLYRGGIGSSESHQAARGSAQHYVVA